MSHPIPIAPSVRKVLEEPNFAFLATVMPDGSPQVTPTWVDIEGDIILVNTAEGRQKPRNVRRDPRVAITVSPREEPYAYAAIRGRVVNMTQDGADIHADKMAKKYLGQERYPFRKPGELRLIMRIQPERISTLRID